MATTNPTLQRLAVAWEVPDDPTVIIDLAKASGILQSAVVANASHGTSHKYKIVNALPTGAFRNIGEGIVPTSLSTDRMKIDLWNLSVLIQEDWKEFANYPGGKAGWIADNLPAYLEGMGQTAAKQIIYGTDPTFGSTKGFIGLHQYAKAFGNVIQRGGTTGGNTSIFAVRWDESNGMSIRKNGTANLIDVVEITGEKPVTVTTNTTTGAQLPVYQWMVDAFMTLICPGKKSVAAMTQIDSTHLPTVDTMNQLVHKIYASTGEKRIYCNLDGFRYISLLKDTKYNMFSNDTNYDVALGSWGGIPIVIDENISSVETNALD